MFTTFDDGFDAFFVVFFLVFALIFGTIVYSIMKGVATWHKNNMSPIETALVKVVAKRTDVVTHHNDMNEMHTISHSSYYFVTFEFSDGFRKEFEVDGEEFGLLIEGDTGTIKFQGTRFLNFERF